ncbi:FAD-dependent oxidoreductase [Streptomyces monticola]|uniref:FAD-dependent oxidoreductase n=1 Tax=Streptomyces monticola TaxID=2666263 RepID=A0ABW2JPM0_9ACTN
MALRKPRDWFAGIDFTDPATAAARIAREFEGWAPELTVLITGGDTAPVLRPLNTLPAGHRWDRVPGVTLLGDAAHLMIPSCEGANLAMYDGAELGKGKAPTWRCTTAPNSARASPHTLRTSRPRSRDTGSPVPPQRRRSRPS